MHSLSTLTDSSRDASPDASRDARARAWAFAFECYRKKKGSRPGAPDDGTESKEDSADDRKYTG